MPDAFPIFTAKVLPADLQFDVEGDLTLLEAAEMGRVLYNTLKPSAAAAQLFTSRGPTKDGDFGVDIMAPGAAFAAISAARKATISSTV